jgi:hypothetical protein
MRRRGGMSASREEDYMYHYRIRYLAQYQCDSRCYNRRLVSFGGDVVGEVGFVIG